MKIMRRSSKLVIALIFLLILIRVNSVADENSACDVTITIPDTSSEANSEITIPVYFDNFLDTLFGFAIWIQSDKPPNVFSFQVDTAYIYDTTYWRCDEYSGLDCIDSVSVLSDSSWDFIHIDSFQAEIGTTDTSGSLVAGWEYVESRSISGNGSDMLIVGIANLPGGGITPGSLPQQSGELIKIKANVYDDIGPFADSIIHLRINTDFKDYFDLVFNDSDWSIWTTVILHDTVCYNCTQWDIDTTQNPPDTNGCLNWEISSSAPCDSLGIFVDSFKVIDSNKVCVNNSTVQIVPPAVCGDLNGDGVGGNILDLVVFINCLFRLNCPQQPIILGDINCDGSPNLLDFNIMVNYIFRFGPPPCSSQSCNK